jgi:hypothetical protein
MNDVPDLTTEPRALQVCKHPVVVQVEFARNNGVCETLEGPARYRAGDAILTGVRGECWPVQREPFLASYSPVPPTVAGADGLYRKAPSVTLALKLDRAMAVPVGRQGDRLRGRPGDWLLRYADGSHGIVRDAIFRECYGPAPGENRWPTSN